MDSTEFAAAVADKTRLTLEAAGESVSSTSQKTGIPRSTLDRKFNAGKGIQALTIREMFEIAKVAKTTVSELVRVYETPSEEEMPLAS